MKRRLAVLFLAVIAIPALAVTDADGTPTDVAAFFKAIQGNYAIELAGGQKPDPNDNTGDVTYDADQSIIRMPYCQPHGSCYLGYSTFPAAGTQAFVATAGDSRIYTLVVTDGGTTSRYQWEMNSAGRVVFRNFQFAINDTQNITLEYALSKAPGERE